MNIGLHHPRALLVMKIHPRKLLDASLAGGRNVVGMRAIENFLCGFAFPAVFGVDRNQDVAVFDLSFVLLGFVFRDPESNQRSGQSANGSACSRAAQRRQDRTSRDQRSYTGNRERPDSHQPAQHSRGESAGDRAGSRSFGCLGVMLVREVSRSCAIRQQH